MPNINLAPFPYNAEQQAIDRRRQLAMALQQQSMQPLEEPSVPGANVSWTQGLAKMVNALMSGRLQNQLDQQQKGLDTRVQSGRQAAIQQMAQAMNIPPTQTQNVETPGGTLPVTLPPPPDAEQNRNQALMGGMASGDPVIQQMAAALQGQTAAAQRTAQQQQFEASQKAMDRGLTQQQITNAQRNFESEATHRTAQEQLAQELANKPKLEFGPQGSQPYMVSPSGATPVGLPVPKDETPHTVTTDEGVMQWNPKTSKFDIKIGNRPPTAGQIAANPPGDWAKTGNDFLSTIPAQWRATVQKVANYEEDPTKVTSMRSGMREQVMQWVNQVNPGYKADEFSNRAPTRKAFTTGTQGQQINAINTAIGHIDMLTGLADKLQNGGFVPGNEAYNAVRTMFGGNAVTNFDTLKDALAGEVASVLSKGSATVSGIADAEKKIKAASSPSQLAGYVSTLIPVMGSKLAALDYQYHQAMGPEDSFSALSSESKQILMKHGVAAPSTARTGSPSLIIPGGALDKLINGH